MALDAEVKRFVRELPPQLQYDRKAAMDGTLQRDAFRKLLQRHNMAMLCMESLLNLHVSFEVEAESKLNLLQRRHYTQALVNYAQEPLASPYAESVIVTVLEVCKTILDVLQDAHRLYPRLAKRYAILHLHCFGAGV